MKSKLLFGHIVCVVIVLLFCCFRFEEAIFQSKASGALSPDSFGSVGGFQMMIDEAHESPKVLFSDVFRNSKVGLGVLEPGPFSIFWKLYLFALNAFLDIQYLVIFSVFLIGIVNGLSFFYVCYCHTKNHLISILGAILAVSLFNYQVRANGHLFGLGSIFAPVLLVGYLLKMATDRNRTSYAVLALLTAMNFNINEYYGFYGCWIVAGALVFIVANEIFQKKFNLKRELIHLGVFGSIFGALMMSLYPHQIFEKIVGLAVGMEQNFGTGISFNAEEVASYTIRNMSDFFVIFYNKYFSGSHYSTYFDGTELTYSIGFFVGLFSLLNLLFLYRSLDKHQKNIIYATCCIIAVSFLLCLHPDKYPSLVGLNYKFAPMFRVTYRSLVYFNIAILFLFLYTSWLWLKIAKANSSIKIYLYFAISLIFVVTELPYPSIFSQIAVARMPESSELIRLKDEDPSYKIINMPFFSSKDPLPERFYQYSYEYHYHRKKVLNFPFVNRSGSKFVESYNQFAQYINEFQPGAPSLLNQLGVKFIIYHKEYYAKDSALAADQGQLSKLVLDKHLEKIIETDKLVVFRITDLLTNFNSKNFIMDVLTPANRFFDFSQSCAKLDDLLVKCGKNAQARLVNFFEVAKHFTATFEFQTSDQHHAKIIEFDLQPLQSFEVALRKLTDIPLSDAEVKVSEVKIENFE